jgi:lipoyl(octanoyl) transferase
MSLPICRVLRLGTIPYAEAWQLQDRLAAQIAAGEHPPTLLLLEHPHTYTFGRRGQAQNLIWNEAELTRRGISVHWVDRGGDVTYHGPGQLVGYPLLPLGRIGLRLDAEHNASRLPQADYVGYLRRLEQVLILALARMGVPAQQVSGLTGVWVQPAQPGSPPTAKGQPEGLAKIAAIGVKVDARGVTRHGFALNVNPDRTYWQGIIACGLEGAAVTSLAELLPSSPAMTVVADIVAQAFSEVFSYQLVYPE